MITCTDEQLYELYGQGRSEALELLIRRHSEPLYRFIYRYTNDPGSAEDVVQDTFIQISQSTDRFQAGRRLKPWLYAIAANKARDHLRRKTRKKEVSLESDHNGVSEFKQAFQVELAEPLAEQSLSESRAVVREVVKRMPPQMWEVLQLAYFSKLPYREIADILEVPLGTVKSRLHAAVGFFGKEFRSVILATNEENESFSWTA